MIIKLKDKGGDDTEKIKTAKLKLNKEQIEQIKRTAETITLSMEAVSEALMAGMKPMIEARKRMIESMRPMIDMRAKMKKQTASFIQDMKRAREELEKIRPVIEKEVKRLPKRLMLALDSLGQQGWYLDFNSTPHETWEFAHAFKTGDLKKAEASLVKHYRTRLDEISESAVSTFPHRRDALLQAFKAHYRGEYFLSVPVILAQADGICQELTGFQLFKKKDKKPETVAYVESSSEDEFTAALLYPLTVVLPISSSKRSEKDAESHLNRHEVLHGVSLDYGTEANSLKAISLLYYIVSVLSPRV